MHAPARTPLVCCPDDPRHHARRVGPWDTDLATPGPSLPLAVPPMSPFLSPFPDLFPPQAAAQTPSSPVLSSTVDSGGGPLGCPCPACPQCSVANHLSISGSGSHALGKSGCVYWDRLGWWLQPWFPLWLPQDAGCCGRQDGCRVWGTVSRPLQASRVLSHSGHFMGF